LAPEIYADRDEAGKALAIALKRKLAGAMDRPMVLAIPRGGVVIGLEVAKALGAELDIVVPRKLGAEWNHEFAIGSVMADGTTYLNPDAIRLTSTTDGYLQKVKAAEMKEAARRVSEYRGRRKEPDLSGRTVIVVDDGIATGATIIAALRWARGKGARLVIAAVPVAPRSAGEELKGEADQIVCLNTPEPFHAIGAFYDNFDPVTDEQVIQILRKFWTSAGRGK